MCRSGALHLHLHRLRQHFRRLDLHLHGDGHGGRQRGGERAAHECRCGCRCDPLYLPGAEPERCLPQPHRRRLHLYRSFRGGLPADPASRFLHQRQHGGVSDPHRWLQPRQSLQSHGDGAHAPDAPAAHHPRLHPLSWRHHLCHGGRDSWNGHPGLHLSLVEQQ